MMRPKFAFALFLFAFAAQAEQAAAPTLEDLQYALHLVGNGEVAAQLVAGSSRERVAGRVSFHFILHHDTVIVRGFNVVFFGVPQKLIAGGAPMAEPLGLLGFAVTQEMQQVLRYDPQSRRISGTLRLYGDASFLNLLARPRGDAKDDLFVTPTLPATVKIDLAIDELGKAAGEPRNVASTVDFRISTSETKVERYTIPMIELQLLESTHVNIDVGDYWFEVARQLCVQPVSLVRFIVHFFPFSYQIYASGEGLPFGQPGANTQWNKADMPLTIARGKRSQWWTGG